MSLDVYLQAVRMTDIYTDNITHNLGKMAAKAGIYRYLWRPEELDIKFAKDLVVPLEKGLVRLLEEPIYFKQFNPENGWGSYGNLVDFVRQYLKVCIDNPDAEIRVSR